ncbi:LSU ribosomal protein L17P [Halpernia humi]|uniref:Large ribosomal subunit protein bL17 n=1 Tax=Halpernia humi TaxID=493375 RepID=A0A1H5UX57_9FLAO|nr:50S ribosomal protein L17 [Halpernia humi]SEF79665.1 LSU ribosomal protein L17P [Halpernia humi]
MRHGKKFNHLSRTTSHRSAMLSNMACSLIEHKRINTTVAKAKALRVFVEPILTKSKEDSTHNRRTVFSYLQSKEAVTELFRTVAPKIADRPGGYTRIIKTGFRLGDAADMAMIELVDFNEMYNPNEVEKKTTRRSRRSAAPKATEKVATLADAKLDTKSEKVEAKVEETVTDAVVEEPTVDAPEVDAADTTEEKTAE